MAIRETTPMNFAEDRPARTRTEEHVTEGYPPFKPMDFGRFRQFVLAGNFTDNPRDSKLLTATGLSGEAAELAEIAAEAVENAMHALRLSIAAGNVTDRIKKVSFHPEVLMDRDDLVKEAGDVLWYYCQLLNDYDLSLDEIMKANVRKLCDRYPDRYGKPEDWL